MGVLLFIGLLLLITSRIVTVLAYDDKDVKEAKEKHKYLSIIGIVLFSLYILYDTNTILLKYKNKNKVDCIKGSLDYYLDIVNLFSNYLDSE